MTNLKEATDKLNAFHLAAHVVVKAIRQDKNSSSAFALAEALVNYRKLEAACGAAIFGEKL